MYLCESGGKRCETREWESVCREQQRSSRRRIQALTEIFPRKDKRHTHLPLHSTPIHLPSSPAELGVEPAYANGKGLQQAEGMGKVHVEAVLGGFAQLQHELFLLVGARRLGALVVL